MDYVPTRSARTTCRGRGAGRHAQRAVLTKNSNAEVQLHRCGGGEIRTHDLSHVRPQAGMLSDHSTPELHPHVRQNRARDSCIEELLVVDCQDECIPLE